MSPPAGAVAPAHAAGPLELADGAPGIHHRLGGETLADGELLEVLTADGWISGHYRQALDPESGSVAFDLHLVVAGHERASHVRVYLPPRVLVRRRA